MIFNLGSINIDYFYSVGRIPKPGETIAATHFSQGLGGKGANMSVAAAMAGSKVVHIGAIGKDGDWAKHRMGEFGVGTDRIAVSEKPTGHAIIAVAQSGENSIIVVPGANHELDQTIIDRALRQMTTKDILLIQNETNGQVHAARMAHATGAKVIYAAAPFDAAAVHAVLPFINILVLNEIEAQQLSAHLKQSLESLEVEQAIVTKGAKGATVFHNGLNEVIEFAAPRVDVVDTTGAGDTFIGYFAAGLDQGDSFEQAVSNALTAASLKVTKKGTADAVPSRSEVLDFVANQEPAKGA